MHLNMPVTVKHLSAALAAVLLPQVALAAPTIGIEGLDGAEHWVWVEGENTDLVDGEGGTRFRDNDGVSGWMPDGPPNVYDRTTGSYNVRSVDWTMHAPADMSVNTSVYVRASANREEFGMTVRLNGDVISPTNTTMLNTGATNPTDFLNYNVNGSPIGAGMNVGSLVGGADYTIRYTAETASVQGLTSFLADGVLLYDGTPVLPTGLTDLGGDRLWLNAPLSADSPILAGAIAPTFDIQGLEAGNQVSYLLNGMAYTPGTAIGVGEHNLVVFILESSDADSTRLAFAGANFTVIPEPGSVALLGAGSLLMVLRRRSMR